MMKKFIITITLLFLVLFGFSQGVIVRTTGTQTVEDMRLMVGLNFYVPVYPDTTTANLTANKGIDSVGALIFCRDINGFRMRRSNPKRWDYVTDSAIFSTINTLKDSAAVLRALIISSTVSAGGNNTDIQFNKSGAFAGSDSLQYDGTNVLVGFNKNVALKKGDYLYFNGVDTTWKIQLITTSGSDHIITGNELRLTIPTTSEGFSINNGLGVPVFQVQGNSGLAYVKGNLQVGAVQYPNTDGISGQVLTTNGTGTPTFQTPAATGITALTGDVTASGTGSVVTTLAIVNSSPNTFGDSTKTLIVTVNAKGLVTSVVSKSILISQSQILNPNIAGLITGGTNIALSGSGTAISPYIINSTAPGTGTVTSITAGAALTGGTITTSGTIGADTSVLVTKTALNDSLAAYAKTPIPNSDLQHSAIFFTPTSGITMGSGGTAVLGNTLAIGIDTTGTIATTTALKDTAAAIRSAIGSGGITALTGDVTASGTGSVATTLATVNSNVGSFTNANLTVNAKGLITAASNGSAGNLTGDVTSVGLATTYNNIVPSTKGGAGSVNGILKANGSGVVTAATGGTDYEFPLTFSSPLSRTTNTISIPSATGSVNGYLNSTDWNTFNNKQNTLVNGNGTTISGGDSVNIGGISSVRMIVKGTGVLQSSISTTQIGDTLAPYGLLYTDAFSRSSIGASYTVGSNMTTRFPSGTSLTMTGSTPGNLNAGANEIVRTEFSGVNNYIDTLQCVDSIVSATSRGQTLNYLDNFGFATGYICQFGAATGKTNIYFRYYDSTLLATSTGSLTLNSGDLTIGVIRKVDNTVYITYKDLTVGGSDSCTLTYTFVTSGYTQVSPATGHHGFGSWGGVQTNIYFSSYSQEPKYVTAILGNSIWNGGYTASSIYTSIPYDVFGNRTLFSKIGGAGDQSTDGLEDTLQLMVLAPKYAIWALGTNNATSGASIAQYSLDVRVFVAFCKRNNIIPILEELPPNNSVATKPWSDTLRLIATQTSIQIVQGQYTALLGTGTNYNTIYTADGTHMNDPGALLYARFQLAQLPKLALAPYSFTVTSIQADTSNTQSKLTTYDPVSQQFKTSVLANTVQIIGNPITIGAQQLFTAGVVPSLSITSSQIAGQVGGILMTNATTGTITGTQWKNSAGSLAADAAYWDAAFGITGYVVRTLLASSTINLRGGTGGNNDIVATGAGAAINGTTNTSTLFVNGSTGYIYVAKTASYTATISDNEIDFTANNDTLTLPTAVGIAGRIYKIYNSGSGWVKTFTTSSQTFTTCNGTPISLVMGSKGSEEVHSNGANWVVDIKPITQGTATLASGTVTISTPAALTNSYFQLQDITTGALTNVGSQTIGTVTNGVSFVINSTNVLDASNVSYTITP